jgi:hypothetical protein
MDATSSYLNQKPRSQRQALIDMISEARAMKQYKRMFRLFQLASIFFPEEHLI